jgi:hypothetical protein
MRGPLSRSRGKAGVGATGNGGKRSINKLASSKPGMHMPGPRRFGSSKRSGLGVYTPGFELQSRAAVLMQAHPISTPTCRMNRTQVSR